MIAGGVFLAWHLGRSFSRHMLSTFQNNRRVKHKLVEDWEVGRGGRMGVVCICVFGGIDWVDCTCTSTSIFVDDTLC